MFHKLLYELNLSLEIKEQVYLVVLYKELDLVE